MNAKKRSVLIVGAGLAGLTAAVRAAELDLSVTVLEQGTQRYPCNSRSSGGILHLSYQDPAAPSASLEAGMKAALGEEVDARLVSGAAARAGAALDWLSAHGTRFVKASAIPWHRWTIAPPRPLRPGFDFPGVGADILLERLAGDLARLGGTIRLGICATAVEKDVGGFRVTVASEQGEEILSVATLVIADGGFQGDMRHVALHITPRTDRIVQRGAGTGSGFGLTAAESLGCRLTGLDRFYGHLLSRAALFNPRLNPYPQIDPVAAAGMVVGADGRRFADEGRGGVFLANALAGLPDPASAFAIADDAIWKAASQRALYPIASLLDHEDGTLVRADTLEELARLCGIDADTLQETTTTYNRIVDSDPQNVSPPRSGAPVPILVPPFVAIPLAPGITNTMGGIAVDAHARALDREGSIIDGLYAVGASAGGLEGGNNVGYVGGLMRALTSGMAAAEHIAANGGKAPPLAHRLPEAAPAAQRTPALVLPLLVRHAMPFSLMAGLVVAGAITLLSWSAAGPWAILAGAGAGLLGFALAKAFTEIAAVILDLLAPG